MRILIAEDEPVACRMLERTLQGWGYDVVVTRDGNAAWEVLERTDRPQIAILDWMMPGLDGLEVCRRLRSEVGRSYVFVLMLTGRQSREDAVEALLAGADDFVIKPFDPMELEARIRTGCRILALEEKLVHQAAHDPLTGILNRGAIEEQLRREVARSGRDRSPTTVLLLDIDNFKVINDLHGHGVGDRVLVEVVRRISAVFRPYDAFGRWGGEEFVVVLPGCGQADGIEVAHRIRGVVSNTPAAGVPVTISVGVCAGTGGDGPAFIRAADVALYRAKRSGRNRVEVGVLGEAVVSNVRPAVPPILLVAPTDRRIMRTILEQAGHVVLEAGSLTDTWRILETVVPGVILVDVQAAELLSAIRADPRLVQIPIVVVTAIADAGPPLVRVGFDAHVPKPVSANQFVRQIELLLNGSSSPPPVRRRDPPVGSR